MRAKCSRGQQVPHPWSGQRNYMRGGYKGGKQGGHLGIPLFKLAAGPPLEGVTLGACIGLLKSL